jgi:hypothetical protein
VALHNRKEETGLIKELLEHKDLFDLEAINSAIELSVKLQDTVLTAILMSYCGPQDKNMSMEFRF